MGSQRAGLDLAIEQTTQISGVRTSKFFFFFNFYKGFFFFFFFFFWWEEQKHLIKMLNSKKFLERLDYTQILKVLYIVAKEC